MKNMCFIFAIGLLFTSCFKEENNRKPIDSAYEAVKVGEKYNIQSFYSLINKEVVSSNDWNIWDLAFYAREDDYTIKLNAAASMRAFNTNTTEFDDVTNFNNDWEYRLDDPKGGTEQRALNVYFNYVHFDTLFSSKNVYVLFLGYSSSNNDSLGYKKVVFDYVYKNSYHFKYANLDGTDEHEVTLNKDETLNFVSFSFINNEIVTVEPDRNTWDLLFTNTMDVVYNEDSSVVYDDYTVVSVLLNPHHTEAFLNNDIGFENFTSDHIVNSNFSEDLNIIGYYWKRYTGIGGNTGSYEIFSNNTYIIKDRNSFIYKMKFLSFLDPETNNRGTISFQYELLK